MRQIHEFEMKNLIRMAYDSLDRAYAPYSQRRAGACLKGASGAYYLGCSIENVSYAGSICAARAALAKAVYEGERAFDALAVVSDSKNCTPPCGICRQMLAEFCDGEMPVICANADGRYVVYALGDLMPYPFQMEDNR